MSLQGLHRRHLGIQARDAGREVQLLGRALPEASSAAPSGPTTSASCSRPWPRWNSSSLASRYPAALLRTGLIGQRFDSLDRLARAAQVLGTDPEGRKRLPEIRNHAIAALGLADFRVRRQGDCGDVFGVTVDAALERYAVLEKSGTEDPARADHKLTPLWSGGVLATLSTIRSRRLNRLDVHI